MRATYRYVVELTEESVLVGAGLSEEWRAHREAIRRAWENDVGSSVVSILIGGISWILDDPNLTDYSLEPASPDEIERAGLAAQLAGVRVRLDSIEAAIAERS